MDDLKRRLDALQRDEEAMKRRRLLESLGMGTAAAAFPGVSPHDFSGLVSNTAGLSTSLPLPSGLGARGRTIPSADTGMMRVQRALLTQGIPSQTYVSPAAHMPNSDLILDRMLAQTRAYATEDRTSANWNEIARAKQEEAKQEAARFFQTTAPRNFGGTTNTASLHHQSQNQSMALFAQGALGHGVFQGIRVNRVPSAGIMQPRPDPDGLPGIRSRWEDRMTDSDLHTTQQVVEIQAPCSTTPANQKCPPSANEECTALAKKPESLRSTRNFTPLGVEEDINWLSEMHCFLRSEIVEVFHVKNSKLTGRSTSKGLSVNQVGIRCRWCADLPPESRVSRSSAFPSSLRQLYQSFTMMVRDHFGPHTMCTAIPASYREHLNHLRNTRNSQGASDSKHYWAHAAHKIGMVDTDEGIQITKESKAEGKKLGNFGAPTPQEATHEAAEKPPPATLLMKPDDLNRTNMFFYTLLLQTQVVHLQKSELVAKRRTLPQGLEGIGCRHCCAAGRYGFSRRFPLRRRSLPEEVMDMFNHIRRCTLCPNQVKEHLGKLHAEYEAEKATYGNVGKDGRGKDPHKEFFDIMWRRLGRTQDIKT